MTDLKQEVQAAMRRAIDSRIKVTLMKCTVTEVDEDSRTITVTDADGQVLYDVDLQSVDGWLFAVPVVGSVVLVGNIGNSKNRYQVMEFGEVEKVSASVGNMQVEIDGDTAKIQRGTSRFILDDEGVLIEKNALSLATVLGALIDQLSLITVTCTAPGTPSSTPLNFAAFTAIKTQLESIIK